MANESSEEQIPANSNDNQLRLGSQRKSRENRSSKFPENAASFSKQVSPSLTYLEEVRCKPSLDSSSSDADDKEHKEPGKSPRIKIKRDRKTPYKTGSSGSLKSLDTDDSEKKSKRFRKRWWDKRAKKRGEKNRSNLERYRRRNKKRSTSSEKKRANSNETRYCCKCGKIIPRWRKIRQRSSSSSSDRLKYSRRHWKQRRRCRSSSDSSFDKNVRYRSKCCFTRGSSSER